MHLPKNIATLQYFVQAKTKEAKEYLAGRVFIYVNIIRNADDLKESQFNSILPKTVNFKTHRIIVTIKPNAKIFKLIAVHKKGIKIKIK